MPHTTTNTTSDEGDGAEALTGLPGDEGDTRTDDGDREDGQGVDGPGAGSMRVVSCPSCSWSSRSVRGSLADADALLADHEARAHRSYSDRAWTALQRAIAEAGAVDCMDDPDRWFSPNRQDIATAIAACEVCPIAFECLDYALSVEFLQGVWGSTTPAERKALRQAGKNGNTP